MAISEEDVQSGDVCVDRQMHLAASAWVVYFVLAPIVWLPGLSVGLILTVKLTVFTAATFLTWTSVADRSLPRGSAGPIGLAILCLASSFALFQATTFLVPFRRLGEMAVGFLILWTFYVFTRANGDLVRVAALAGLVLAGLSAVILVSALGFADFPRADGDAGTALISTGFANTRTGWSNAVALFVPYLAVAGLRERSTNRRVLYLIAVVSVVSAIAMTGGRAGLLAALLGLVAVLWFAAGRAWVGAIAVVVVAAAFLWWDQIVELLRLNPFGARSGLDLDRIASGRLTITTEAWSMFLDQPIIGHGYGSLVPLGDLDKVIHNLALRLGVEGGVVLVGALLWVVVGILGRGVVGLRHGGSDPSADRLGMMAHVSVVAVGLAIALFEGDVILGAMHLSAVWWAAAGSVVALATLARRPAADLEPSHRRTIGR